MSKVLSTCFAVVYRVESSKSTTETEIRKSIERVIFLDTNARLCRVVASACKNIAAAAGSQIGKSQHGVEEIIVRITEDLISVNDWVKDEIDRPLKA